MFNYANKSVHDSVRELRRLVCAVEVCDDDDIELICSADGVTVSIWRSDVKRHFVRPFAYVPHIDNNTLEEALDYYRAELLLQGIELDTSILGATE